MRFLPLLVLTVAVSACHNDPPTPADQPGFAKPNDSFNPVAPAPVPDALWYPHHDAPPFPDSRPPPRDAPLDASAPPTEPPSLEFVVAKERVIIPGTFVMCRADADCVATGAHCAEMTQFAVHQDFLERAQQRADRPCRGVLRSLPPTANPPRAACRTGRCELEP